MNHNYLTAITGEWQTEYCIIKFVRLDLKVSCGELHPETILIDYNNYRLQFSSCHKFAANL